MSFFAELKRRNVFRVGIAYLVVAWLVMQVADVVINNIGAPEWVFQAILLVLGIGFPLVLVFAWAFEMTPDGLKKEKDVDRSQSITPQTGKKLNNTILMLMALAIAYLLFDKFSESGQKGAELNPPTPSLQPASAANRDSGLTLDSANSSIAVLPFANRSNQEDDVFFTDGIHDDLLTQLAKISDLKVISRTSVMKYKSTEKTIPEIAAELGVSTILEGGIQRAGNRIRINAQLISVDTDEHLWAETFDREMTIENIFDIQSEITRQIVTAVRGELSDEESEAIAQLPTSSLAAYEAYLHARTLLNAADYNQEKYLGAEVWVNKALEYDPEFALAWAMMVEIHGQAIWMGFDPSPDRHQKAQQALSNASRYGPFLPETLAARAEYLYRVEADFAEAETALLSATEAKPGDTDLLFRLAFTERRTGKWEQAVGHLQLAIELDPENLHARSALIETLIFMNEYDRAFTMVDAWIERYPQAMDLKSYKTMILVLGRGDLEAARNWHNRLQANSGNPFFTMATNLPLYERNYRAAIDVLSHPEFDVYRDQPGFGTSILISKSQVYALAGDKAMAKDFAQQALAKAQKEALALETGTDTYQAFSLQNLAMAYSLNGQMEEALKTSEKTMALYPESRDSLNGTLLAGEHARIMAMAGLRDEALAEIERLLSTPAGLDRWDLHLNPNWDFFRDDARFNELIRPLNLGEGVE